MHVHCTVHLHHSDHLEVRLSTFLTNLLRDVSPIHNNLEDELPEPVGGHEYVSLLAPVLTPGVLHPPPGHTTVILYMAACQHLQ
jgi:hypothetical protein